MLMNKLLKAVVVMISIAALSGCFKSKLPEGYQAYEGKWIVVNYWAEWCKPCIREIPELNKLAKEHADQVVVLALNFDEITGADLDELHQQMGIEYPKAPVDPKHHYGFATPKALPTTIIIKPSGELHSIQLGEQTDKKLLGLMGLGH